MNDFICFHLPDIVQEKENMKDDIVIYTSLFLFPCNHPIDKSFVMASNYRNSSHFLKLYHKLAQYQLDKVFIVNFYASYTML